MEETLEELLSQIRLSEMQGERLAAIKHEPGKLQWLCARMLLAAMLQRPVAVVYDSYGKPKLGDGSFSISISHSALLVAVMGHPQREVGIDVQLLNPKLERIAAKFLSASELAALPETGRLQALHIYWGAKEALYKLYGKKGVEFKSQLAVERLPSLTKAQVGGSILMPDAKSRHLLAYEWIGESALVYVLKDY